MEGIIERVKQRYSLLHFGIACLIVNLGTIAMFVIMLQRQSLVQVIVWFPVAWVGVFILWVFFTEFLNLGVEKEEEE